MPELPEVETIASDLRKELLGQEFLAIKILAPKSVQATVQKIHKVLKNKKLIDVIRLGKSLYLDFGGIGFYIHLKMTGQLVWQNKSRIIAGGHPIVNVGAELPNKFTRAILYFSSNNELYFNDVRRFGWIKLITTRELAEIEKKYGLNPLLKDFTGKALAKILANKKRSNIKSALLDQTKIAGIGNIYADEALFLAGILPTRLISDIKTVEWQKLAQAIKKVLLLSIKLRGTSFSDYRDGKGNKGNFVTKLQVYGRGKEACKICKTNISKIRLSGRGTHYCALCQK